MVRRQQVDPDDSAGPQERARTERGPSGESADDGTELPELGNSEIRKSVKSRIFYVSKIH